MSRKRRTGELSSASIPQPYPGGDDVNRRRRTVPTLPTAWPDDSPFALKLVTALTLCSSTAAVSYVRASGLAAGGFFSFIVLNHPIQYRTMLQIESQSKSP